MGLTDEGFTALRAADYLTQIRADYEAALLAAGQSGSPDWVRDTFLANTTAIMATRLGDLSELTQAIYDARDVNAAQGVQLSNLALIVGVVRREATASTALVDPTGTAGTFIPQGTIVEGGGVNGAAQWATTEDATLPATGVPVTATAAGAVVATTGQIDKIVVPISGWTAVTNPAAAVVGEARESDDALRLRRQQSLQISGATSANALRSNLLNLTNADGSPTLLAAIVLENDDAVAVVVEGVTIDAHSVIVIVHPDTIDAAAKAIVARAIYDLLAIGISTSGTDVVATVTGLDQLPKTIKFDLVDTVLVDAIITLGMEVAAPGQPAPPTFADVKPLVEAAVTDYFLALSPGDDVLSLSMFGLIGDIAGIQNASISFSAPVVSTVVVPILVDEIGAEGTFVVVEAP